MKVVIVGGVAGGMSAAARLRRMDESAEITVLEKGEYISFANCGLPYYIGGAIKEREKLLVQTPEAFRSRFNVDVRTLSEAVFIDTKKKTVRVMDISRQKEYDLPYDKLILSPGASPIRPPLPGIDHPKIFTLRNIPDTDLIFQYIETEKPRRALIIGGGFIGLEMAENLHAKGILVTLVEMAPQVLNVMDPEMAALVHQEMRSKHVEFYLNEAVASFADAGGKVRATLKSGKEIDSDMVILSIGVKPDARIAKEAGLEIGERGGIAVNDFMQTSDPDIYAVGDAVESVNPITGKKAVIPLAGPANKQGRIAADNIVLGNKRGYRGTLGTAIAKVFDLSVGVTGMTEKALVQEKIPYLAAVIHPSSHASYYPNALQMTLKILFSPKDGRLYGAQGAGFDGVDKRLDVFAALISKGGTVYDLQEIEHAYAPPFASAKDPVNMAGFVAENMLEGRIGTLYWHQVDSLNPAESFLLDVRTPAEFKLGTIPGAVNIPVDDLRERMNEIPQNKKIVVFCRVGLRGYIAGRTLLQKGFKDVVNLTGGYLTWSVAKDRQDNPETADESIDTGMSSPAALHLNVRMPSKTIELDACGLQCPGPIMRVKAEMDKISGGDRLSVTATDPGFAKDLPSWAKATGNKIVSLVSEKGTIKAVLEKTVEGPYCATSSNQCLNDKTLIVFDGDLDKAIASFIIANGALAMGRNVTMFFTFWGLMILRKRKKVGGLRKNLIEKMFGWMLPRGSTKLGLSRMNMAGMGPVMIRGLMKKKNVDALETLIQSAIRGGAKLIACQMSMDLMGIKPEELIDGVEIGGVATYLEAAEHADTNLFI